MIGVTGATGNLGRLVITSLKEKGATEKIVAIARSPEKGADLGVEVRRGDYDEPASLVQALQGVETLLLISGSEVGKRTPQHRNVINAAVEAGVSHLVYTSLLGAEHSTLSLADEHRETEQLIKDSGMTYTLLRNGWYTENYLALVDGALAGGALLGAAGDGQIASATRADFAEAASVVLLEDTHKGKVYELAGDESYTLTEFAAELSKQVGKEIPYKDMSEAEYISVLVSVGLPEGLAQVIAGGDVGAAKGELFDDSKQLSSLIGRPTTSLSEAMRAALAKSA